MGHLDHIKQTDYDVYDLICKEEKRQYDSIRLIPSENYVSHAVLEATGSVFTNKYSEGYAGKRYYEGQVFVDELEELCKARLLKLFGADAANVQPYSGSPANLAVYFALLKPGDTVMGMALPHGGHLTHGWNVSITGTYFRPAQYTVHPETHLLDYDALRALALAERPKMIIAGATAYPRIIDFEAFAAIAKEVDAYLLVDMAHISGLVAAGAHPTPVPHAHVVSSTTHKTLRGPRGGMLLMKNEVAEAIDRAVFPGLQGGPHDHTTAALAVALKEADTPEFKEYAFQIVRNAKALAERLMEHGFRVITGGTDNHLVLVDVTSKGTRGRRMAKVLDRCGIVCNMNTIPFDPRKPFDPSGIRLGTPAVTSRGMKESEMRTIADFIASSLEILEDKEAQAMVKEKVAEFCKPFPAPGIRLGGED
jgi:glycine hydroxymethyltransferase